MVASRCERARLGMAYCATHNRLFPHPFVGWLTPHGTTGLALVPARCDWCTKERGDEVLSYSFPLVATPIPGGAPRQT
jgi:hypothetical protein